jgi:Flp pilus assembly pilin Flp
MDLSYWRAWIAVRSHRAGQNELGANLVEYILLIAFIAIIVIVAVKVLGRTVSTQFSSADSSLQP